MNVSAVNCTPIKPQVSFGRDTIDDSDYIALKRLTGDLNDSLVTSDDIKKPAAVAASVGLAGILAFAAGKNIASIITKIAPKTPEIIEGSLKKGSNFLRKQAATLQSGASATKLGKVKSIAGKAIGSVESAGRKAYAKIAANGAASAFANGAGIAAAATVIPSVCSRDNDGDGVSDIMQKGTNVYTGTQTKLDKLIDNTTKFSAIAELLA